MEIRIDNLENIREAAKSFISEIGDRKVFAFYGKWGQARPPSSRPSARNWA